MSILRHDIEIKKLQEEMKDMKKKVEAMAKTPAKKGPKAK